MGLLNRLRKKATETIKTNLSNYNKINDRLEIIATIQINSNN